MATADCTASKTDSPIVRAAWDAVTSAHGATNLAYSCFADLATLFRAIADDWANLHDSEREQLEPHITALRAALGFPSISGEGGTK